MEDGREEEAQEASPRVVSTWQSILRNWFVTSSRILLTIPLRSILSTQTSLDCITERIKSYYTTYSKGVIFATRSWTSGHSSVNNLKAPFRDLSRGSKTIVTY